MIDAVWDDIESWLQANARHLLDSLRPGATQQQIDDAQQVFEIMLPDDYIRSLSRHDGELYVDSYEYSPLETVVRHWQMMRQLVTNGAFDGVEVGYDQGIIQQQWWHSGWIPFAADSCGNMLCIDTDPAENGTLYQLIASENVEGPCLSRKDKSFSGWLARFRDGLREGLFVLDEDGFLERKV